MTYPTAVSEFSEVSPTQHALYTPSPYRLRLLQEFRYEGIARSIARRIFKKDYQAGNRDIGDLMDEVMSSMRNVEDDLDESLAVKVIKKEIEWSIDNMSDVKDFSNCFLLDHIIPAVEQARDVDLQTFDEFLSDEMDELRKQFWRLALCYDSLPYKRHNDPKSEDCVKAKIKNLAEWAWNRFCQSARQLGNQRSAIRRGYKYVDRAYSAKHMRKEGWKIKEIASKLDLCVRTIKGYLSTSTKVLRRKTRELGKRFAIFKKGAICYRGSLDLFSKENKGKEAWEYNWEYKEKQRIADRALCALLEASPPQPAPTIVENSTDDSTFIANCTFSEEDAKAKLDMINSKLDEMFGA